MVRIVMELNRNLIFVYSSQENFHFLLEISACSDFNLVLVAGAVMESVGDVEDDGDGRKRYSNQNHVRLEI